MKLSQSVAYAVHASLRLAEKSRTTPVSCSRLAESGNMPERFLLQILRDLTKQGIVHSSRGGGGGFTLDRNPEEISLLELIEAIDGPLGSSLPTSSAFPQESIEVLQQTLRRIADITREQLAAVKLSDMMPPRNAETPLTPAVGENSLLC